MRPAVFLDLDDTLIDTRGATAATAHPGYHADASTLRPLPGAADACRRLSRAGFALVVVTNQSGVARGHTTPDALARIVDRVRELFALDAVYACPYHPDGVVPPWNVEHRWRKPAPGMLIDAAGALGLDLRASWLVGDSERDIEAAIAAGIAPARAIRVGPGGGARDIAHAADLILAGAR